VITDTYYVDMDAEVMLNKYHFTYMLCLTDNIPMKKKVYKIFYNYHKECWKDFLEMEI